MKESFNPKSLQALFMVQKNNKNANDQEMDVKNKTQRILNELKLKKKKEKQDELNKVKNNSSFKASKFDSTELNKRRNKELMILLLPILIILFIFVVRALR